ncbi:MAG: hypothetical protein ED556_05065 [Winogradskyella sp.]|uniref:hypothetical protein n=1 Tax=Winogradskyella sp. TaxID=1883156 RepID=UPI000F4147BF|nr:hypothetical protein [Winogradskyella sp.]RNC86795.1 MAG: hypothetical protein ED556_05065 [Winogradskyella sp.]
MKRIITLFFVLLNTSILLAQAPQKVSYQAIIRDSGGLLLTDTNVGMQISILETSATGTAVYVETHTPTTNANGLISIEIGTGVLVSGDFTTIDWEDDLHFIKVETDPSGGTSYTITGTSQLLSVPYALHSKTVEIGNTLDQAYDEGLAPGAGRSINADAGSVEILATDNFGLEVYADPDFTGIYVEGSTLASQTSIFGYAEGDAYSIWGSNGGSASALYGFHDGTGEGLEVFHSGTGKGIFVENAGTGRAVDIFNGNPANASNALTISQGGTGVGFFLDNAGPGKGAFLVNASPTNADNTLFANTLGTGTVASLMTEDNNGNASTTLEAITMGTGSAATFSVMDEVAGKLNMSPTVNIVTNGKGPGLNISMGNVAVGGDSNTEPGILSLHSGFGNAGFFRVDNTANTSAALDVLNEGTGNGVHISSPDNGAINAGTALFVEQEDASTVADSGRAAHFDLANGGTFADSAVLITSSATGIGTSALRVIPADPTELAGVFEGNVEIDSDLTIGGDVVALTGEIGSLGVPTFLMVGTAVIDDLTVTTAISAPAKAFKIDHPIYPEKQFLYHNSIESNERMNIYSGNVTTNAEGYYEVQLPDYMSALNGYFKYQLTVLDKSFAQAVIWEQIDPETNTFMIKTNEPNIEVSWQVTGIRIDTWALENPLEVEVSKN